MFRLGLVGAGRMGRTHLRALAGSTNVAIAAVAEPLAAARGAVAGSGIAVHPDVASLIAAGGIDGVLIAAPSDRHVGVVAEAAAAGLPILCEKPCGMSSAEVGAVAATAARYGVPLQVAYWRRYVPALEDLRERMRAGGFGDLHLVISSQWDGAPPAAGFRAHSGGIFIDMGVHEFDQLRWLTGQEFGELHAVASPLVEDPGVVDDVDSAQALAALSGGASAIVSLGRFHPGGDMARVEVFGSRDATHVDFLDPRDGDRAQIEALQRQAEGFARFARGGPPSGASVADAAAAMAVAERATSAVPALRGSLEWVTT